MTESLYAQALTNMEATVHELTKQLPPPLKVPFHSSFVYRYTEKTAHQAIVQKLARYVSSLQATHLLLAHGFIQEQAALQRILDEIQEDITFLSLALIFGEQTTLHESYLLAFYEEEFDPKTGTATAQKRPMPARQKIRAYIARAEGKAADPSRGAEVSRTISKTYSGYVHAASPQIMEMFGGIPPRFHMQGMQGNPLIADHRDDLWNYFFRGILAFAIAAKAFGNEALFASIHAFSIEFSSKQGKKYRASET